MLCMSVGGVITPPRDPRWELLALKACDRPCGVVACPFVVSC